MKPSESCILSGSKTASGTDSDHSQKFPQSFDPGRECSSCGLFKSWTDFDKKPRGINGRDSRCKSCISKQKNLLRERKKVASKNALRRTRKTTTVLNVSDLSIERIYCPISEESLSEIMADLIDTLILTEQRR